MQRSETAAPQTGPTGSSAATLLSTQRWGSLISRGAAAAKEGMSLLQDKIQSMDMTQGDNSESPFCDTKSAKVPRSMSRSADGRHRFVFYFVQNVENSTKRKQEPFEWNCWNLPFDGPECPTVGMVKDSCPLVGNYHFRFKTPAPQNPSSFIWLDNTFMDDLAPSFDGCIYVKLLHLSEAVRDQRNKGAAAKPKHSVDERGDQKSNVQETFAISQSKSTVEGHAIPFQEPDPGPAQKDLLGEGGSPGKVKNRQGATFPVAEKEEESPPKEMDSTTARKLQELLDGWAKNEDGTFKDIRLLLSTVDEVIWNDSGWKPVSMSDLMVEKSSVKNTYRKVMLVVHPDKNQAVDPERQFRAHRIFQALNESWKSWNE